MNFKARGRVLDRRLAIPDSLSGSFGFESARREMAPTPCVNLIQPRGLVEAGGSLVRTESTADHLQDGLVTL